MLNRIGEFVASFFDQLVEVFQWLLKGFISIISEIFYAVYSGLLTAVEAFITAIDLTALTALTSFSDWGILPPQVVYVLGKLSFTQCLAILSVAYMIRLTLNLIPGALTRV